MTDNEIIKALERCPQHTECCYCNSLEECGNKRILTTSVFDLLNRQKDKIKEFDEKLIIQQGLIDYQKVEIERLQKNIDGLNIFTKNHIKVIRLQAIKEFAERLKEKICCEDDCGYHCFDCCYECKDYVTVVDSLVNEMTEENNSV